MSHSVPQASNVKTQAPPRQTTKAPAFIEGAEQLWMSQLAQSLGAQGEQLQAFASLMQANQWPVDIGRLFMDSRYAYGRLALAHTSTDEPLRHLALVLFEGYQRLENRRRNLCVGLPVLH
jgi:hypothetical protein